MRIVCLSDTHDLHDRVAVPDGDLLLHAGDLTARGRLEDVEEAARFMRALPHRHKVIIAGNHDRCFEETPSAARARLAGLVYLQDDLVEIRGLRIYGSPWQPWFHSMAFNVRRGGDIARVWRMIPDGLDVLLTHGPPRGHGDVTVRRDPAGCLDLLHRVREVRPRLHAFGHIHEGYGVTRENGTLFVNASTCTVDCVPSNAPVVLDWNPLTREFTLADDRTDLAA